MTMQRPATLTGQDIGEAEGAASALLDTALARTGTGITRPEYIAMRVVLFRGPHESAAALHDYLASQPQLGLDRAGVAELLDRMEAKGLLSGGALDGPDTPRLTEAGATLHGSLSEEIGKATKRVVGDMDPDDLAVAHRVLVEFRERATRVRAEL